MSDGGLSNLTGSFGETHKPTLLWGMSLSTVLLIAAVVIIVLWVIKREKRQA